ncbi:hypothetical protein BE221DRAFT_202283 [Ostreococcus tauri]|uniref:Uncharacterized protein n=1 Tax=Ostreococcus tauri TaxID=70448 RepID=A0A1Y5HWM4_OSTTA|nr:hypothetical protein BE221DRAFT_202283 [Ostreococcus tauri]
MTRPSSNHAGRILRNTSQEGWIAGIDDADEISSERAEFADDCSPRASRLIHCDSALICIDAATRHSCVFALDGNAKNSTVVGEAFLKHSTRVEEDLDVEKRRTQSYARGLSNHFNVLCKQIFSGNIQGYIDVRMKEVTEAKPSTASPRPAEPKGCSKGARGRTVED